MRSKAVCLLSGGLDSTVTTYYAKHNGYDIATLSIAYGQRHTRELSCAETISKKVSAIKHITLPINFSHLSSTSLIKNSSIPIAHQQFQDIGKTIPSTYVPGRNIVFLSLALSWAEALDATNVFIGINAVDYSGYPDCRAEFISAFEQMAKLGTKKGIEGIPIHIQTPLLDKTKQEIIRLGHRLGVPFEYTWSCYKGDSKACGVCDSCQLRLKGFKEAGLTDPLSYETYPTWY
ncbi:MAG: 7-cyano-7-deazaguanine synthase QueC [Candidatus Thermoplasmatota archaeon]|nr:7-cyano-7-deazaguanine synthase QueC [Candidatus Thermoplasmatota archaeon]MBU1941398.1 7-cyano-7-deazaguanine synthase QueC [Candidatus Thermoplasmatota archaeon]